MYRFASGVFQSPGLSTCGNFSTVFGGLINFLHRTERHRPPAHCLPCACHAAQLGFNGWVLGTGSVCSSCRGGCKVCRGRCRNCRGMLTIVHRAWSAVAAYRCSAPAAWWWVRAQTKKNPAQGPGCNPATGAGPIREVNRGALPLGCDHTGPPAGLQNRCDLSGTVYAGCKLHAMPSG